MARPKLPRDESGNIVRPTAPLTAGDDDHGRPNAARLAGADAEAIADTQPVGSEGAGAVADAEPSAVDAEREPELAKTLPIAVAMRLHEAQLAESSLYWRDQAGPPAPAPVPDFLGLRTELQDAAIKARTTKPFGTEENLNAIAMRLHEIKVRMPEALETTEGAVLAALRVLAGLL